MTLRELIEEMKIEFRRATSPKRILYIFAKSKGLVLIENVSM